jgi:hypothetical protein
MNETIGYVSQYLGVEVCTENGIPETLPVTEAEAARTLIKLYEVLKANIQNDVHDTITKELRQREKLYEKIDGLIEELRGQGKI